MRWAERGDGISCGDFGASDIDGTEERVSNPEIGGVGNNSKHGACGCDGLTTETTRGESDRTNLGPQRPCGSRETCHGRGDEMTEGEVGQAALVHQISIRRKREGLQSRNRMDWK